MYKITMPPGGQTTDDSLISEWFKTVGDMIKRGDILCTIETDKAILEVESYCEGILRKIVITEGNRASEGDIIAYIGEADEPLTQDTGDQDNTGEQKDTGNQDDAGNQKDINIQEDSDKQEDTNINSKENTSSVLSGNKPDIVKNITSDISSDGKILASPKARDLARKGNIDLADVDTSKTGVIKHINVLDKILDAFYDA